MKYTQCLGSSFLAVAAGVCSFAVPAHALDLIPLIGVNQLAGPAFLQPFAGLSIASVTNGIAHTEPFFESLTNVPANLLPSIHILGNVTAYDSGGNQIAPGVFSVVGVDVTKGGSTFKPQFGTLDFDGKPSVTFTDYFNLNSTVTLNASDPTFAYLYSAPSFSASFGLSGLSDGSFITFQVIDTMPVPEPATLVLFGSGLAILAAASGRGIRYLRRGWPASTADQKRDG